MAQRLSSSSVSELYEDEFGITTICLAGANSSFHYFLRCAGGYFDSVFNYNFDYLGHAKIGQVPDTFTSQSYTVD